MAQRVFRSDDTNSWFEKFSSGAQGPKTYASNHTLDSTDGFYNGSLTGTAGASTGTTSIADGTYNLPCKIVQTQGTGATATPNHEFNFLISVSGGVATFRYPLTLTFNTGAQMVTGNAWSTVVINSGVTVTVPAWDGTKGGELVIFASASVNGPGNLSAASVGFRGGASATVLQVGHQGESELGAGSYSTSTNGSGGSGGAADGVHSNAGGQGTSIDSADLRTMTFSGGGPSGGAGQSGGSGSGTSGFGGISGGNITVVTRQIGLTSPVNFVVNGQNGGNGVGSANLSGGNGGNGGNVRVICQSGAFGTNLVNVAPGSGGSSQNTGSGQVGQTGNTGKIHVDYAASISGSNASPAIDSRQDSSLYDGGGMQLMALL